MIGIARRSSGVWMYGFSSCRSLLPSHAPWVSCARSCLMSCCTNGTASNASSSAADSAAEGSMVASAMRYLVVFKVVCTFAVLRQRLAQPWRRRALEHLLQLAEDLLDGLGLRHLDRVNLQRDHTRRARAADRGHV